MVLWRCFELEKNHKIKLEIFYKHLKKCFKEKISQLPKFEIIHVILPEDPLLLFS